MTHLSASPPPPPPAMPASYGGSAAVSSQSVFFPQLIVDFQRSLHSLLLSVVHSVSTSSTAASPLAVHQWLQEQLVACLDAEKRYILHSPPPPSLPPPPAAVSATPAALPALSAPQQLSNALNELTLSAAEAMNANATRQRQQQQQQQQQQQLQVERFARREVDPKGALDGSETDGADEKAAAAYRISSATARRSSVSRSHLRPHHHHHHGHAVEVSVRCLPNTTAASVVQAYPRPHSHDEDEESSSSSGSVTSSAYTHTASTSYKHSTAITTKRERDEINSGTARSASPPCCSPPGHSSFLSPLPCLPNCNLPSLSPCSSSSNCLDFNCLDPTPFSLCDDDPLCCLPSFSPTDDAGLPGFAQHIGSMAVGDGVSQYADNGDTLCSSPLSSVCLPMPCDPCAVSAASTTTTTTTTTTLLSCVPCDDANCGDDDGSIASQPHSPVKVDEEEADKQMAATSLPVSNHTDSVDHTATARADSKPQAVNATSASTPRSSSTTTSIGASSSVMVSCHQCKLKKPSTQCMQCTCNEQKGGGGKKRCVKKYCQTCFPECDTRVLTNAGFLFLADIEARIADEQPVLYACYDTSTQSIVYKPGQLVLPAAAPTRWVDFTHAGTRRLWDATSDDYGSTVAAGDVRANHLTLRTTPEHDMYVQLCTAYEKDGREQPEPRMSGRAPIPAHKMPAREMALGYQCECDAIGRPCTHGYSLYRMYTGAASGLHRPADAISLGDCDPHSPVAALGLQFKDELDAFLELFGCWLSHGFMSYASRAALTSNDAVCFALSKNRDSGYLRSLLVRLHLECDEHFISNESDLRLELRIIEPRWFRFFDDEFGIAYSNSRPHDSRLALLKQGMHSTQRRPSTAASISASATASESIASSTRARSLSSSISVELVADCSGDDGEGRSPNEADSIENEDVAVASGKWLPDWSLFRLDVEQLRLVIESLRRADGRSTVGGKAMQAEHQICASSVGFRDQLIQACLHAGYSAYFCLNTAAGEVRGYNAVPNDNCIYTAEEIEAALRADSTRQFEPLQGNCDSWWVCYSEAVSELLPAQDIRFEGSACHVRQDDEYEEQRSGQALQQQQQQQAAGIATEPADLYDQERDGRVWCVNVQHDDHLIFVQRAQRNASGVVTKVGRTMISGNCLSKHYNYQMAVKEEGAEQADWICPACKGLCSCAACARRKLMDEEEANMVSAFHHHHTHAHVTIHSLPHHHHSHPSHSHPMAPPTLPSMRASCHQCKSSKSSMHLLACSSRRSLTADGKRLRDCKKKYCAVCLERWYGLDMDDIKRKERESGPGWRCPACEGICPCAACRRKGGRKREEGKDDEEETVDGSDEDDESDRRAKRGRFVHHHHLHSHGHLPHHHHHGHGHAHGHPHSHSHPHPYHVHHSHIQELPAAAPSSEVSAASAPTSAAHYASTAVSESAGRGESGVDSQWDNGWSADGTSFASATSVTGDKPWVDSSVPPALRNRA